MSTQTWKPLEFFDPENTSLKYAVLILNRPITVARNDMISLWNRARLRLLVDGGTNRWHGFVGDAKDCVLAEMITGDLDSATEDVLAHYKARGVEIIETPDQNETDFTKALRQTAKYVDNRQIKLDGVIAVAETSGRLDHIISVINTLYKADSILGQVPVFLLSGNSMTWLLTPGIHEIDLRKHQQLAGKYCSLMPIGEPAHHVTTTGLKWNLVDQVLQFGGMVSTSNGFNSYLISIQTDRPLLWNMTIGEDDDNR